MDVQTAFYHGIRQNIRRVLVALGPERIEKGLTAFEDGASNWSDCFFARAFEGEADLSRTPSKYGKLPFARHHAMPTLYICDLLGDEKFDLRVAVAMVWHTFDQQSLFIDRKSLRKFIEDVLDESRPSEVMELLRQVNYTDVESREFSCAT